MRIKSVKIKEIQTKNGRFFKVVHRPRSEKFNGLRTMYSEKFTSLKEAQSSIASVVEKGLRKLRRLELQQNTWGKLVADFELAHRKGDIFVRPLGKKALSDYLGLLHKHTAHWADVSIIEIDRAEGWRTLHRIESEVSVAIRKRVATAIRAVYEWALLTERIKKSTGIPVDGFKSNRRSEQKLPEILNREQIKTLLSAAKLQDNIWYPIWTMAVHTGMRSGELFALRWENVDLENGLIQVHENWSNKDGFKSTKGGYWRVVPIGDPRFSSFLKELKLQANGREFVLPRLQSWKDGRQAEILRTFCIGIGIPSVKFHTLRACFATELLRQAIAPIIIMKICGWKDLKTMEHYVRFAGIDVEGATTELRLLPDAKVSGEVVDLFGAMD